MRGIVNFLVDTSLLEIANKSWVLFAVGALFLISIYMRWRMVALSIFGGVALMAVARYSKLAEGRTSLDLNMVAFVIGSVLVVLILVYFLFIRGD